jgi:hypothetical protein
MSTTSSGGKSPGPTRAWALVQAGEAFLKETLAPHADDLAPGVQTGGDLIVAQTLGSE